MEKDTISIEQNSRKDKFHLLRVPKGFDIKKLNGVEYNPHQVLELEVIKDKNGLVTVYELGAFDGQSMDLNLLVKSGDQTKAGPSLRQNLCVNKTVQLEMTKDNSPTKHIQHLVSGPVCFPEGLKQRFTPIGSGNPIAHKKDEKRKSKSKRKRAHSSSADESSHPSKKHREEDLTLNQSLPNCSMDFNSHGASTSFEATPTTDKVKKHKKKKHKSKSKSFHDSDGEEDSQPISGNVSLMNGCCSAGDGLSEIKIKNEIDAVNNSGMIIDRAGDAGLSLKLGNNSLSDETKKQHSSRSHNMSDDDATPSAIDCLNLESNELMLKEKKKKEKKKKRDKKDKLSVTVL